MYIEYITEVHGVSNCPLRNWRERIFLMEGESVQSALWRGFNKRMEKLGYHTGRPCWDYGMEQWVMPFGRLGDSLNLGDIVVRCSATT